MAPASVSAGSDCDQVKLGLGHVKWNSDSRVVHLVLQPEEEGEFARFRRSWTESRTVNHGGEGFCHRPAQDLCLVTFGHMMVNY